MKQLLMSAYQARVPTIVWGPPGVGKTAMIEDLARTVGAELICPVVRSPEDIVLPVSSERGVEVRPVGEFVRAATCEKNAIVFIDELSTLPPSVQAATLRFIDSGMLGGLRIPPGVWRVAAGNPPDQAAGGWDLAPPTANRLLHLRFRLDAPRWADGFVTYWNNPPVLPGASEAQWAAARALVASFIRHRPTHLLQFPQSEEQAGRAWPSPRSWDNASRVLAATTGDEETEALLVAGCVGEGVGMEFLAWRRALDLPDPEEVLAHPGRFTLPSRGDQAYAVLAAVVAAAVSNLTKERWLAAWVVLAKAADQGAADVAAAAARSLAQARKAGLPFPKDEVLRFAPLLKAAGLLSA